VWKRHPSGFEAVRSAAASRSCGRDRAAPDTPKVPYDDPFNLLVADLIGSPAANSVPARLEDGKLKPPFGDAVAASSRIDFDNQGVSEGKCRWDQGAAGCSVTWWPRLSTLATRRLVDEQHSAGASRRSRPALSQECRYSTDWALSPERCGGCRVQARATGRRRARGACSSSYASASWKPVESAASRRLREYFSTATGRLRTAGPSAAGRTRPWPEPSEAPARRAVRLGAGDAEHGVGRSRKRCHGGGPALGALYGAVNASPSTCMGQPPSR
jgi:hypothetical protein